MRDAFARTMTDLASVRPDVCLLSGDIGNRMFDRFKEIAPDRFINCGIAEANMMSVAAGMALSGMRPVVYTIAPFTTTRCLEQIKIGAAYHSAPIVIVGTGSGLSYAELGATHHSLEDMAILKAIPDINILAPADRIELVTQLTEAVDLSEPTYIRIGKKGERDLHVGTERCGIGRANMLKEGTDLIVVGVGPIVDEALNAAKMLEDKGISVAVAAVGGVRPLDNDFLELMSSKFKIWVSIEEHSAEGGLGSSLLHWMHSRNKLETNKIKILGAPHEFIHELGSQPFTRKKLGIDAEGIAHTIAELLSSSKS